jgi:DNA polymerase-4
MNTDISPSQKPRKIIHIDMDCFYAAVEIRDNPTLIDKPVAVGGPSSKRSVLCTANYIARRYGVHSAMPTGLAYKHCPQLRVLPVDMPKYKQVARKIQAIFQEFTPLVEPLSLDEAYLDVTDSPYYQGSATRIAKAIQARIWESEKLIASAGVAPNKFLAKIASGWKKPNGFLVICPEAVQDFVQTLPVDELYGVGKITAKKFHAMHLKTCADLQKLSFSELTQHFGKLGQHLHGQCRGIDNRSVDPHRIRKSLSVEQTFDRDIDQLDEGLHYITELYQKLTSRLQATAGDHPIKNQYLKIKFSDFKRSSLEISTREINLERYLALFNNFYSTKKAPIRLLGVGVRFAAASQIKVLQRSLF